MKNITGAGIIIYYDNRNGFIKELKDDVVFLVLEDNNGNYDFPKGGIEKKEEPIRCAVRETREECSLKKDLHYYLHENKFIVSGGGLVMYLANFLPKNYNSFLKEPKVIPNPYSNFMEHKEEHMWLTSQEINKSGKLLHYLTKYLEWAQNNI